MDHVLAGAKHSRTGADASPPQRDGFALAIFLALTCVMTNPLVLHIANAVEDKQDALLNTWVIAWVGHALVTDPFQLFNANIFYPYPNALAFSETMLPQGLFALPFNLAFDNTVLGYNLVLLASFFLAAYAMYLFVFDLTRNRGAGIVAGTIFAFNPYNLGNLAQVQLLSFGWMPVAMMYLRRILQVRLPTHGRRPLDFRFSIADFRCVFLFALFFSLQALSSFYYAFLAGFAVALCIIWFFITHDASRFTPSTALRARFYVSRFACLLVSTILIALIVVPFFIPYWQVQREMGFERKIAESEPFSASLKLYTEVSPQNVLYGSLLAPRPPMMLGGYPLDNLFPGMIALALGIVGVFVNKNSERWFYFLLLTFAFLLSLGPRLFLAPNMGTAITLPYRWLYDVFPLLHALRAPVRFDALVMLALAILAGFGIHHLTTADHRSPAAVGRFLPSAFCLLIFLEYLAVPAANVTIVPTSDAIPEYVRWLAKQPRGVVLELPMIAGDPSKPLDLTAQYLTTYHWHATPDGYSGFNPPRRGEIAYDAAFFPTEPAIRLFQVLDVQYLIVHTDQARFSDQGASFQRFVDVEPVRQFDQVTIYHVTPRSADVTQLMPQLYLPNPVAPNQTYFGCVVIRNGSPMTFAVKPTDTLRVDAQWQSPGARIAQTSNAALPLLTYRASVVPIRLLAPSRAGNYRLAVHVTGAGLNWNLSGETVVQEGEPVQQVVLPVSVTLDARPNSIYAPGDTVRVNLQWLALNKVDAYYSASVRVVDARGNKIVQQDREPVVQTLLWKPGDTIPDRFEISLPRDLAPGEYSVQVKMYQADQGVDALLLDGQFVPRETIELGKFVVRLIPSPIIER